MKNSKKLKGLFAATVAAVGLTVVAADPSVTIDEVKSGESWSKITVSYTLGGVDAATDYKVAFDVTAGGQTASVTNDAAKLTDEAATKEINTADIFGKEVTDIKAKVNVSLIAIKPKLPGVQLWEGGPFFAECNVGATKPEEYGYYFWWGDTVGYTNNNPNVGGMWVSVKDNTASIKFSSTDNTAKQTCVTSDALKEGGWIDDNDNLVVSDKDAKNHDAARAHLGAPWRMMTKAEITNLIASCTVEWTDNWNNTGIKGKIVKGQGDYSDNSIFLPAAGYGFSNRVMDSGSVGDYWSSSPAPNSSELASCLVLGAKSFSTSDNSRYLGFSVRAVRGSAEGSDDASEEVVAFGEKEFALVVFRDLLSDDDIEAALQASGAVDKERILELIGSSPAAYRAFKAWAEGLGDIAVATSSHAGDSFAFGVEELFTNKPEVRFTDVSVNTNASGTLDVAVTVKDGGTPKPVSSANVAQMFEATTDVADWTEGRIEANVTDRTKAVATPVEFTVKSGDGTAEKAFLRIRK